MKIIYIDPSEMFFVAVTEPSRRNKRHYHLYKELAPEAFQLWGRFATKDRAAATADWMGKTFTGQVQL